MEEPGWINVQARHCPRCGQDYPPAQERCPRCGEALVDKTVRVPAPDE